MSEVKTWRYVLPSIDGEGSGIVILDSTGFFASVGDYGDYAYWWRYFGEEGFRNFFLKAEKESEYFLRKLSRKSEIDIGETARLIKETILSRRREGYMTRDYARREWERAKQLESDGDEHWWYENTWFACRSELLVYDYPACAKAFVEKFLPRLAKAIEEELKNEMEMVTND